MASFIALRKAIASSAGFSWKLTVGRSSPSTFIAGCSRSFNTGTPGYGGDEKDTVQVDNAPKDDSSDHRQGLSSSSDRGLAPRQDSAPASFLVGDMNMVDPFSPRRTITQMLDLMNHLTDPFFTPATTATSVHGGRQVREDENNLYLSMEMPGLGKEDVKVYVENENTLVIRGEAESSTEEEGRHYEGRKYYRRLNVPASGYRVEITGEMKNGVLKVVIPKVTDDEKNNKNVMEVKVE